MARTVGKETRMKMLRWKFPRLCGLTGALVACGYATSPAWAQQNSGGFNSQPLVNTQQKPQSSSWLPKLPFTGSAKPSLKAQNAADDSPAQETAKGTAKEPADLMSLAHLNERRGQVDLAKKMYKRELERNPNNGKAFHRLAVMSAKDEQWDEANEYFMRAEQLQPNESELYADMGYALYLQHRLEPAETYLRRAVKISPRNEAAYNNLGIVLGVQGKFDEAFSAFKRVGTTAEAHTNMAYVHTQLGDVDMAMQHLNQALSLDPNLKVAAIALMQLNDIKKHYAPKDEPLQLAEGKDAQKEPAAPPPSVLASSAASSAPRQAPRRAASERIEEITERPASSAASETRTALSAPLAAELSSPPAKADSFLPPAQPAASQFSASSSAALPTSSQLSPWLTDAARSPAATVASKPVDILSQPPVAAERHPLPTIAVAPPRQTVAPARPVVALSPAAENKVAESAAADNKVVENNYVAARPKPAGQTSPVGKPPREVAARPLPGKNKDATAAAASASLKTSFTPALETSEIAHAAEPSIGDRSHNISASALATTGAPSVTPALASVSVRKEKPLAPPPAQTLAPIVSPSERMQQLRAKERAEAAEHKHLPQRVHSRPAGSAATGSAAPGSAAAGNGSAAKSSAKDASLLSLLPATAAGMIPSIPEAANDTANPAVMLPTRQPSMKIPRAEDMLPADAMIYQAPTSSLHPAAQSLWSSSNQPLRYLTDQGGMSSARQDGSSGGGSAGNASGRSASLGGATVPGGGAVQPSAPTMPRTY
jgi:Tfp pilus assembly protein PilF